MKHFYAPGIAILVVAALAVLPNRAAKAQCPVTAERLIEVKDASRARAGTEMQAAPVVLELDGDPTVLSPAGARSADNLIRGGAVDLYVGLQPGSWQTWRWVGGGGGELTYWALDDGKMGPSAAAAGGGHITEYEFAFGLHFDFAGDVLRPYVIVSFYNAPADPVANAANPVVPPFAPVSSIGWMFGPVTGPAASFAAYRSGLIDLAALGLDFALDETYYVEVLPLEWSSYPAGAPVADPDVHAIFMGPGTVTYGTNQNRMWSDLWVRPASCTGVVNGNRDGYYDHPAEMDICDSATTPNQSGIILRGLECPHANTLALRLNEPERVCLKPGETVSMTLSQACLPGLARGYQVFLAFDPDKLTFNAGSYTPLPYGLPIIEPIAAVGGDINLAAGINDLAGQTPTSTSADLVTLTFTAGPADGLTTVVFRAHDPPTRFSDELGQPVVPWTVDSPTICVDGTPPNISCPANLGLPCTSQVPAPATDLAQFVAQGGSANDGECYGAVTVTHVGDVNNGGSGCPSSPYVVTRTYRATDCAGNQAECIQTITVSDDTLPTLASVPADRAVNADAGGCTAILVPPLTLPSATDNCDPAPLVEYKRSDRVNWNEGLNAPYPAGDTDITWRATDACQNSASATTTITVNAVNELLASVQLQPVFASGSVTRCITFEVWHCPAAAPLATVEATLTFHNGVAATAAVLVPCGSYNCVTARDKLHTLRRTVALTVVGTQYIASFVGDPASGGDWLIGGNFNDDNQIDILDFAVFSYQYVSNPTPGADTSCATTGPHADANGDGWVDTGDFSFIQINFLKGHEANCCGQPNRGDAALPAVAISAAELMARGQGYLAVADLNADGWLDLQDIVAFMGGARPWPSPAPNRPTAEEARGPQSAAPQGQVTRREGR